MVWLGGPRRGRGTGGPGESFCTIPPGYHQPRMSSKDRQRLLRDDWILLRVTTAVLVLAAATFIVIIVVIIATHSYIIRRI
jgi:hypothetical protein